MKHATPTMYTSHARLFFPKYNQHVCMSLAVLICHLSAHHAHTRPEFVNYLTFMLRFGGPWRLGIMPNILDSSSDLAGINCHGSPHCRSTSIELRFGASLGWGCCMAWKRSGLSSPRSSCFLPSSILSPRNTLPTSNVRVDYFSMALQLG